MEVKEVKQVFYNGDVFNVDINNIKSIDKTDVALLDGNNLIVYWDKKSKSWKKATEDIENKFLNIIPGKFKLQGSDKLIDIKINKSTMLSLKDNTYAKVKFEKIIKLQDKNSNIWEEVSEDDDNYQIYNLIVNKSE